MLNVMLCSNIKDHCSFTILVGETAIVEQEYRVFFFKKKLEYRNESQGWMLIDHYRTGIFLNVCQFWPKSWSSGQAALHATLTRSQLSLAILTMSALSRGLYMFPTVRSFFGWSKNGTLTFGLIAGALDRRASTNCPSRFRPWGRRQLRNVGCSD